MRLVKCKFCGLDIDRDNEEYIKLNNGYYHKKCGAEVEDRTELYEYIKELFHLKAPGPINLKLIKEYHDNNHYSYKSMFYTLKYFYEIQGGQVKKANERVGIIPYVYEDAKNYYENLTKTQNKIAENIHKIEKELETKATTIIVKKKIINKKQAIDLEELG